MAILKTSEIRKMGENKMEEKLEELKTELMKIETTVGSGGIPENPGKVKEIKKTIARIKTIKKEKESEE